MLKSRPSSFLSSSIRRKRDVSETVHIVRLIDGWLVEHRDVVTSKLCRTKNPSSNTTFLTSARMAGFTFRSALVVPGE